jgi:hypothetical protein
MTRRFFGIASLLLTLLAGGCVHPLRSQRTEDVSVKPPSPISPYGPAKDLTPLPSVLPDKVPTAAENVAKAPPATDSGPKPAWLPQFTSTPPPPIVPSLLSIQHYNTEPIANPVVAASPPKHPVVLALECALDNRHEEALKHLQKYDAPTQDLLLRMLSPFSRVAKNGQLSPADVAVLSEQMERVREFLQQRSEFAISKVCFCEWKSIRDFAVYKPLKNHEFGAASPGGFGEQMEVYVGFKNFSSRFDQDRYETTLASQFIILDDKQVERWRYRFKTQKPRLASPLTEYYLPYSFSLPDDVPPGTYTLVVEITDETTPGNPRTARETLPLRVIAPKD